MTEIEIYRTKLNQLCTHGGLTNVHFAKILKLDVSIVVGWKKGKRKLSHKRFEELKVVLDAYEKAYEQVKHLHH